MLSPRRPFWPALTTLVWLAGLAPSGPLFAEVAVAVHELPGRSFVSGPFVLRTIVDDPDPMSNAWVQHSFQRPSIRVLNAQGAANDDGPPATLYHLGTDLPIVVWSKNGPQGYDLVISRFENDAWTPPQPLAATLDDELDPHLFVDPQQGAVHLVYWVRGATSQVMHMQASPDLSSWSPPEPVSLPGEIAARPAGTFYQGALHVVYESHSLVLGGTPRQIILARQFAEGYASEVLGTSSYSGANRPQVHDAPDRLWVEWIDSAGEVSWVRQLGDDPWEAAESEPFESVEERDYHVRGAVRALALD